jgi:hypothetical protein
MNNEQEVIKISGIRDNQSNVMIDRFKELVSEERLDDAFSIADEWFEWLHPSMAEQEQTLYSDEEELKRIYTRLTEG